MSSKWLDFVELYKEKNTHLTYKEVLQKAKVDYHKLKAKFENKSKIVSLKGGKKGYSSFKTDIESVTQKLKEAETQYNLFKQILTRTPEACENNLTFCEKALQFSNEMIKLSKVLYKKINDKKTDFNDILHRNMIISTGFFKKIHENNNDEKSTTLKIATYANFPPIVAFAKENPYGFEVELIKLIFDKDFLSNVYGIELELEFVKINTYDKLWLIPEDCTLAIGGFSRTPQRDNDIDLYERANLQQNIHITWTIPYYFIQRTLLFKKSDEAMVKLQIRVHNLMTQIGDEAANKAMTELPAGSIIIATKNSTGYLDSIKRLENHGWSLSDNINPTIEFGTNTEHDIHRLKTEPLVKGVMRGSDVGAELVQNDAELGMFNSWKITEGIVYNYGINNDPNEGFSIASKDSALTQFMNLRITQLLLSGEIAELIKKMEDGIFDYRKK